MLYKKLFEIVQYSIIVNVQYLTNYVAQTGCKHNKNKTNISILLVADIRHENKIKTLSGASLRSEERVR